MAEKITVAGKPGSIAIAIEGMQKTCTYYAKVDDCEPVALTDGNELIPVASLTPKIVTLMVWREADGKADPAITISNAVDGKVTTEDALKLAFGDRVSEHMASVAESGLSEAARTQYFDYERVVAMHKQVKDMETEQAILLARVALIGKQRAVLQSTLTTVAAAKAELEGLAGSVKEVG